MKLVDAFSIALVATGCMVVISITETSNNQDAAITAFVGVLLFLIGLGLENLVKLFKRE